MQVAGSLDTECGGGKLTHQTLLNGHAIVGALSAEDGEQGHTTVQAAKSGMLVPARMVAFGEYVEDGTASAMKARDYKDATDLVSHSLRAEGFDASEDGTGRGTPLVPVVGKSVRTMSGGIDREDMHTLVPAVAPALTAANDPSRSPQSSEITQQVTAVHSACMAVRRLTPMECERLQGFDDNHTMIPWKKKPADQCPDGPRYKALGNSMAVNCMEWIGQRIDFYDRK
jgi:site-specific DNA-cytosine methylase